MLKGAPHRDKETLEHLYYNKRNTYPEVAEILDVSTPTIGTWMSRNGICPGQGNRIKSTYAPITIHRQGYCYWQSGPPTERKSVYVHRLLAVSEFGFAAVKGMNVHHENGIEWDNRPENIEIIDPEHHGRMHGKQSPGERHKAQ